MLLQKRALYSTTRLRALSGAQVFVKINCTDVMEVLINQDGFLWENQNKCCDLRVSGQSVTLIVNTENKDKTVLTSSPTHASWTWCFSDRASWIDYILITNLMHWLLFIHKLLLSSTCFETEVLIFRRIQLYTCSIWYCHSLWEFLVACRYTVVYLQASSAHLQEDTVVHMQHMLLSLSMRVLGGL